jgi:hypothetical protein
MGVVVVKTIEEWVIGRWRRPFRIWCKFRGSSYGGAIVDLGDKKDSEMQMVEQRNSEIQVGEPKELEILQQKVLEIQVVEQKDLVIPAVHLNPVGGYNNQSDGYDASQTQDGGGHYNLRHPQHEDQMNNYPQNGYGIQPQVQYNNNQ